MNKPSPLENTRDQRKDRADIAALPDGTECEFYSASIVKDMNLRIAELTGQVARAKEQGFMVRDVDALIAPEFPEDYFNPTNIQKAILMARGTLEQRAEARRFFRYFLLTELKVS